MENNMMKIRVCNEKGRTLKIFEVSNPIQVATISYKHEYWEYIA